MSLISSKLINGGAALGAPMSAYTAVQSHVFAGAGNFTLPFGDWWVCANADIAVSIYPNAGGTGTLQPILAAGQGGLIRSDGVQVVLVASAATTAYFLGPA